MAKRKTANKNVSKSAKSLRKSEGDRHGEEPPPPSNPYNWMKPGAPLKYNNIIYKLISHPSLDSATGVWTVTLLHPVELNSVQAECSACSLATKSLGSTVDLIVRVPNTCSPGDELRFQLPSTTADECEMISIRVPETHKAKRGGEDDSTFVVVRISGEVIHLATAAKQETANASLKSKATPTPLNAKEDALKNEKHKAELEVERLPKKFLKTVSLDPGQPLGLTMYNSTDGKPTTRTPFLYMVSEVKSGSQCDLKGVKQNDCIYTLDGNIVVSTEDLFNSYRAAKAKAIDEDRLLKVCFVSFQSSKS